MKKEHTWSRVIFHHRTLVYELERPCFELGVRCELCAQLAERGVGRERKVEHVLVPFDVNHVGKTCASLSVTDANECTEKQHKAEGDCVVDGGCGMVDQE